MGKITLTILIKRYLKRWGCYKSDYSIDKLSNEILEEFRNESRLATWATVTLEGIVNKIDKGEIYKEDLEPELSELIRKLSKG